MRNSILILLFFFASISAFAQNLQWARRFGSTIYDDGSKMVADASGNIYLTGDFGNTVDFDPGPGMTNLTSNGGFDVFIAKFTSNGALIWAKSFGSSKGDQPKDIALDASGNVIVTGTYQLTCDFDPGAGTTNLTAAGNSDIFILKLDTSGNFKWAKSFGGTSAEDVTAIKLNSTGKVILCGGFAGDTDFDPGVGIVNKTSLGAYDIYILQLSLIGDYEYVKTIGSTADDRIQDITTDASDNILAVGNFSDTADFDPGAGIVTLKSNGQFDIFVLKLDASGNYVWAKSIGSTQNDFLYAVECDNAGNPIMTGYHQGTIDFDPGAGLSNSTATAFDAFVLKFSGSGNFMWVKAFYGSDNGFGNSLTKDASGNIFTMGYFVGTVDFDPGTNVSNLTAIGTMDLFVVKLDSSGKYVWAKAMGGSGSQTFGHGLVADASGNLYIEGSFFGVVDFDPGVGQLNLASAGQSDAFLMKLGPAVSGIPSNNGTKLKIHPNPCIDFLEIDLGTSETISYSIMDAQGKVVFEGNAIEHQTFLDVSKWNMGIYFIVLNNANHEHIKIVKQ